MSNKKADKANEYVPKVTREDVLRVIRREFPGNKPELNSEYSTATALRSGNPRKLGYNSRS